MYLSVSSRSNQIKANKIKSNQIKSNGSKSPSVQQNTTQMEGMLAHWKSNTGAVQASWLPAEVATLHRVGVARTERISPRRPAIVQNPDIMGACASLVKPGSVHAHSLLSAGSLKLSVPAFSVQTRSIPRAVVRQTLLKRNLPEMPPSASWVSPGCLLVHLSVSFRSNQINVNKNQIKSNQIS